MAEVDRTASTTETPLLTAEQQRASLLEAQRKAHEQQPRSYKPDALREKIVSVEPDGTGPTPTESFDTDTDQKAGSGSGSV